MTATSPKEPLAADIPKQGPTIHWAFLDGLRGVAALYVVLFHFVALGYRGDSHVIHRITSFLSFGHTAVNIFIVLSGFSLMLPVARSLDGRLRGGWQNYLRRRALRIIPPYYAALAISVIVDAFVLRMGEESRFATGIRPGEINLASILAHLALIHNIHALWHGDYNMAMWSVATEWQIYFLLPSLLLPVWRRFGISGMVITGVTLGLLPIFSPIHDIYLACFWYIGLFSIGAAGAVFATKMLANENGIPVRRLNAVLVVAAVVLAAMYAIALKFYPAHTVTYAFKDYGVFYMCYAIRDTIIGCLTLCLILYCVPSMKKENRSGIIVKILSLPVLVTLGAFSYSLYLTHCTVLRLTDLVTFNMHYSANMALMINTFIALPIAIVFAYLFHIVCERPFMQMRNKTR